MVDLDVAIVADDLTGALDTGVMFASRGYRVCVPLRKRAFDLLSGDTFDICALATNSRDCDETHAVKMVRNDIRQLTKFNPRIWFKKVDSRLKGHIGKELSVFQEEVGRKNVLVVPALPRLGRIVKDGYLSGNGIETPIHVRSMLGESKANLIIPDCQKESDLNELMAQSVAAPSDFIYLGASSLAGELAQSMPHRHPTPGPAPKPVIEAPVILIVGSRDPISLAQVDHLRHNAPEIEHLKSPNGTAVEQLTSKKNVLLQCCSGNTSEPSHDVETRFAKTAAEVIAATEPRTIIITGGNTAHNVLSEIGVEAVSPIAELFAGVPMSRTLRSKKSRLILTKSGGFGQQDMLTRIFRSVHTKQFNRLRSTSVAFNTYTRRDSHG